MKTSDTVFLEKYTSHFIWKVCVWEGVGNRTKLQHINLPTLMAISVSFPLSWVAQPEARVPSSLLRAAFLYHVLSPNWSGIQTGLVSKTNWLPAFTELYNSSIAHSISPGMCHYCRLWNGKFDRHRTKITVMQFTGHSLPVHQFVTAPWDFNPVPYCQPSSPTSIEYALPPSLECHVWRGRRSIYNS